MEPFQVSWLWLSFKECGQCSRRNRLLEIFSNHCDQSKNTDFVPFHFSTRVVLLIGLHCSTFCKPTNCFTPSGMVLLRVASAVVSASSPTIKIPFRFETSTIGMAFEDWKSNIWQWHRPPWTSPQAPILLVLGCSL